MSNRIFIALSLLLTSVHFVQAGLMTPYTPDDLAEKAEIICNGLVTDITVSPKSRSVKYENVNPDTHLMKIATARIKVLAKFKGDVAEEIQICYPQLDEEGIRVNPPQQIRLLPKKHYRFYLKSVPDQPYYVSALDGKFDDAAAVEPLADNERDDNPPLCKEEALELAKQCLAGKFSDFSEINAFYEQRWTPRQWTFRFYVKERSTYPSYNTSDAKIVVNVSDRKVDASSWYSKESPSERKIPDKDDIGKEVFIYCFDENGKLTRNQQHVFYEGTVEKITDDEIIGSFVDLTLRPRKSVPTAIARKHIQSIQRIHRIERTKHE